ncbi:MAG: NAD(P)-dependent glycerol-3-phosphate dehydrogenase [Puniceicoccales bacterium]|jgi:glycerol-3-phosphate dehydrogenase (NAD(P)+)|nr:NAD(P)-dependent glycerol-3-phosphate dehydrogenase [Puniceicoccales bacterium]
MNIAIFGAGAWGTAVACYCKQIGHGVTLLPKFEEQAEKIIKYSENVDFLPGIPLPSEIKITTDVAIGLANADVAFLACPSVGMEDLCRNLQESSRNLRQLPILISLCKGIQNENLEVASDLIERILPNFEYGVLAGPTNAREIAEGGHAAMVLASKSGKIYEMQKAFNSERIRIYSSADVKGAELGGCLKNVYAIGAGICDGLHLGDNAKAAYLTRSLREMISIGVALGGQAETFYGLSGFGDFIATCMGEWSRNRTFGERIASGESVDEIFASQKAAVEGYKTAKAFHLMCEKLEIEAPIMAELHSVLFLEKPISDTVNALINRPLRPER